MIGSLRAKVGLHRAPRPAHFRLVILEIWVLRQPHIDGARLQLNTFHVGKVTSTKFTLSGSHLFRSAHYVKARGEKRHAGAPTFFADRILAP